MNTSSTPARINSVTYRRLKLIVPCLLLLTIVSVALYIALYFFINAENDPKRTVEDYLNAYIAQDWNKLADYGDNICGSQNDTNPEYSCFDPATLADPKNSAISYEITEFFDINGYAFAQVKFQYDESTNELLKSSYSGISQAASEILPPPTFDNSSTSTILLQNTGWALAPHWGIYEGILKTVDVSSDYGFDEAKNLKSIELGGVTVLLKAQNDTKPPITQSLLGLDENYARGAMYNSMNFVAYPGYYTLAGSINYKYTTLDLGQKVLTPRDRYLYVSSSLNDDAIENDLNTKVWDNWRDGSRFKISDHIKVGKSVDTYGDFSSTTITTINSWDVKKPTIYIENGMLPYSMQDAVANSEIFTFTVTADMYYTSTTSYSSQWLSPSPYISNTKWFEMAYGVGKYTIKDDEMIIEELCEDDACTNAKMKEIGFTMNPFNGKGL